MYLWVQLDQNRRAKDSDTYKISQNSIKDKMTNKQIKDLEPWFDGGFKLDYVKVMMKRRRLIIFGKKLQNLQK